MGEGGARPEIGIAGMEDAPDVARLILALEQHYAQRDPGTAATLAMVERTLREREGTVFALARMDGEAAGLACFARVRPGQRLQGVLWLKELFVAAPFRGRGLGTAMLAFLAGLACREGLGRIDLTTESGNAAARRFYERLGARAQPKVFYRFDAETLPALAAGAVTDRDPADG